jgi:hypothetical protein
MMERPDEAKNILHAFNTCSTAMDGLLYLPTEEVGNIIESALAMRREINRLSEETDRLEKQLTESRKDHGYIVHQLFDGDGIRISEDNDHFMYQCCKCDTTHKVEIERDDKSFILKFYEAT